jgi:DNA-binding beta-propeller fold protein YncE
VRETVARVRQHRQDSSMRSLLIVIALLGMTPINVTRAEDVPLVLDAKIPLGAVSGRIDHMAIDLARQRLFVAELGNDSVGVVALKDQQVIPRIRGLKEPQGVAYVESAGLLYVANAGDGSVRIYQGTDLTPTGTINLGDDADNMRVDQKRGFVWAGYGSGALAAIDPNTQMKVKDVALKGHPESFQLEPSGNRIFVNVPDAHQIAVIDAVAGKQISTITPAGARSNFPMAIDDRGKRVLVVFRSPARLSAFALEDGKALASIDVCGDADDVFVDAKRRRVYVSCGEGAIDVLAEEGASYARVARIPTESGARTSLFVPDLDRLYVAVRAKLLGEPAAIWVFRPQP